MNRQKKNLWKWAIPFFSIAITLILFKVVFLFGYVPTESMEPTLKKDSYIVGTRIYSRLGVGDIIIFHHDGKLLVKRIAAEEGEPVVVEFNFCCHCTVGDLRRADMNVCLILEEVQMTPGYVEGVISTL